MADYVDNSQAVVRVSTSTELMPPPPAKRIKRPPKVLDEDTYTNALSDIIARDFFPGLSQAESQNEYLQALESKDKEWIASAGRKLTEVMTPGRRLHTPTPSHANPMRKTYNTKLSLDAFQAKYTSEDNASFNDLLDDQNQQRRDDYGWIWKGNKISNALVVADRKKLENKQVKMLEYGDRPAMPDTWKADPHNSLMFAPNNDVDQEVRKGAISHSNTRLPEAPLVQQDGIIRLPDTTEASATPRINGYSLVDDEPSPSELGAPPLTWGTIDDLLPSSGPSPFKIADAPRREVTLHRMIDKVAKNKRMAARAVIPRIGTGSSTSTATARRTGSMTPAAQRLWSSMEKKGGLFTEKTAERYRWTPTPAKKGITTPMMKK